MRKFSITTVARWMMEPLPKGVRAYMKSQGRLYRLERIRSYNSNIQPILTAKFGIRKFTGARKGTYTLDSPVFLSLDTDLTGLTLEEIPEAVFLACSDCWALQNNDDTRGTTAIEVTTAPQQAVVKRDNWTNYFRSRSNPRHG